jgi:sugar phosphate isomerase/epimerase
MPTVTALSTIAYAHYSFYDALPRLAARGFRKIEVGSFGAYCYHFNNGSPRPAELKSLLAAQSMTPIALNWSGSTGNAYDRAEIERWLAAYKKKMGDALEVGIPMMTMHFGRHIAGVDKAEARRIAADVYSELAAHAREQGMTMLLELPHLYLVHDDCESVIALLDQLAPEIGLLIDSSHFGVIDYDLEAFLERVGDRLRHVHLRDSVPQSTPAFDARYKRPALAPNPAYPYCLTLTPGLGVVDFKAFGQVLDRIGYAGDVTAEFEYFDMPLDEIEAEYDAGLDHLLACGWQLADGGTHQR